MSKTVSEEKVREIVREAVDIILDTMAKMFEQQDYKINRLEQKVDTNQELNNKQFDELKAELSTTVSRQEFNKLEKRVHHLETVS